MHNHDVLPHRPQLLQVAASILRDPTLAEDVVQEVSIEWWRNARTLDDPAKVFAYLRKMVVRFARDMARARGQVLEQVVTTEIDPAPTPYERLLVKEVQRLAVGELTLRQAEVWQSVHVDGLSIGETARRSGVSRKSVITALRRAERALLRAGERAVGRAT